MSKATALDMDAKPPATTEEYYGLVKDIIKSGDLIQVKTTLSQWRSNTSIAGPSQEEIDYLIPQAVAGEGQPEILKYLLSLGGNLGTHSISLATSPEIFKIFLAHGWKADDAIFRSHVQSPKVIALFLAHGANPNSSGPRGFSTLDIAALCGPLGTVKLLLEHGATVGPSSAALHAAAQGDTPDRIPIMAYLVEKGADINGLATDYPAPSEAIHSGRKGTPLHTAAKWGNREAEEWLLEYGADPEARNEVGETPKQWGKRFDRDGPERGVRLRRAILRKNEGRKEERS